MARATVLVEAIDYWHPTMPHKLSEQFAVVLFTVDVARVAAFYEHVIGMQVREEAQDHVGLAHHSRIHGDQTLVSRYQHRRRPRDRGTPRRLRPRIRP